MLAGGGSNTNESVNDCSYDKLGVTNELEQRVF